MEGTGETSKSEREHKRERKIKASARSQWRLHQKLPHWLTLWKRGHQLVIDASHTLLALSHHLTQTSSTWCGQREFCSHVWSTTIVPCRTLYCRPGSYK
eukprot:689339-Rhodomonas_salina.1